MLEFLLSETTLIILSITSILFAIIVIFSVLVISYNFLSKWLRFLQKEQTKDADKIKADAYTEASTIIEKAKVDSITVMDQANRSAQRILSEAKVFSEDTKKDFDQRAKDLSQKQISALEATSGEVTALIKDVIDKQGKAGLDNIKNIAENMKGEALGELDEFKEVLKTETIESQKEVEEKLAEQYAGLEEELKEYKKQTMSKIDNSVYEILHKVIKFILGKAISMEDHEELIKSVLDSAKRNGVFGE